MSFGPRCSLFVLSVSDHNACESHRKSRSRMHIIVLPHTVACCLNKLFPNLYPVRQVLLSYLNILLATQPKNTWLTQWIIFLESLQSVCSLLTTTINLTPCEPSFSYHQKPAQETDDKSRNSPNASLGEIEKIWSLRQWSRVPLMQS